MYQLLLLYHHMIHLYQRFKNEQEEKEDEGIRGSGERGSKKRTLGGRGRKKKRQ